jgi:hypothetical protein
MSHSTQIGEHTFIHDGDAMTGGVRIVDEVNGNVLYIPGLTLFEFVGQQLQMKAISEIEDTSGVIFLGRKILLPEG